MKVFGVYTTDMWETRSEDSQKGIFSTVDLARDCVRELQEEDTKVIIETMTIDEVDSGAKLEVYDFVNGLEWNSTNSDAEVGSLAMVSLYSSYYEVKGFNVEKRLIPIVIEHYMRWCEDNKQEPEIEYMSASEFVDLDDSVINHVLYHAELYKEASLLEFFKALNEA
jgi:hypothetical protein